MSSAIEICNVKPLYKGDIMATCDVYIPASDLEFNDILIFQKGDNRWISMPSKKNEKTGVYKEMCGFRNPGKQRRFRDQVMAQIEEYLVKNPDLKPEPAVTADEDCCPF